MKENENTYNKFRSTMPPHLSPEEQEEWLKDEEWDRQEYERRKKEGFYPEQGSQGIMSKIIKKFNYKAKKWDDPMNYGP
jgi:hypothetical protein